MKNNFRAETIGIATLGFGLVCFFLILLGCTGNNPMGVNVGIIASGTVSTTAATTTASLVAQVTTGGGEPMASVSVVLYDIGNYPKVQSSSFTTTADGKFIFNNVTVGFYIIVINPATNPQFKNYSQTSQIVEAKVPATNDLGKIVAPIAGNVNTVGGTLLTNSGGPMENVLVALYEVGSYPNGLPTMLASTTADGKFLFSGVSVTHYVLLVNPTTNVNFATLSPTTRLIEVKVAGSNDLGQMTIGPYTALNASGALTLPTAVGRIVDSNGSPLASVGISLYNSTSYPTSPPLKIATTTLDGKFVFSDLTLGYYILAIDPSTNKATYPTYGFTTQIVQITQQGANTLGDFTIGSTSSYGTTSQNLLSGRVTTSTGEVVYGVAVLIYKSENYPSTPIASTTTGADGKFIISGLSIGTYTLRVDPLSGDLTKIAKYSSYAPTISFVAVSQSGLNTLTADIKISTSMVSILGKVYSVASEPLAGVTVQLKSTDSSQSWNIQTTTTSDGSYLFSNLPQGQYILVVDPSSVYSKLGQFTQIYSTSAEGINAVPVIALSPATNMVVGRVVTGNGDPVSGLTVTLYKSENYPAGAINGTTLTGGDGKFTFSNVSSGSYAFQVTSASPGQNYPTTVEFRDVKQIGLNQISDIVVKVTSFSLNGIVEKTSGDPMEGVPVTLYKASDYETWVENKKTLTPSNSLGESTTTNDGSFFFDNLPAAGHYVVFADPTTSKNYSSYNSFYQSVAVAASGATPLITIKMTIPANSSTIITKSIKGHLIARIGENDWSTAQLTLDTSQMTVADVQGNFKFQNVQDGLRTVTVSKPGFKPATFTFEVRTVQDTTTNPATKNFVGVFINNAACIADLGGYYDLGDVEIQFDLLPSAILAGTVKRLEYFDNTGISLNAKTTPLGFFEFQLYWYNPDTNWIAFSSDVVTDSNGTWKVCNVPQPPTSVGAVAFPKGMTITPGLWPDAQGKYHWTSNFATAFTQSFTSITYPLTAGNTRIMDFTVPDNYYQIMSKQYPDWVNIAGTLQPNPSDPLKTDPEVDYQNKPVKAYARIGDTITFNFKSVTGANGYKINFVPAYNGGPDNEINQLLGAVPAGQANIAYSFTPSAIGLTAGAYTVRLGAVSPTVETGTWWSSTVGLVLSN
ncbi:MAG: carboxypeptidase regulatory-like domain-containing protein [Candidatus Riflebacteria bacterium]|nr:carboxypeptidase regulatory-like domain-containing protein [Candidatus Riflebacteria bacterium]